MMNYLKNYLLTCTFLCTLFVCIQASSGIQVISRIPAMPAQKNLAAVETERTEKMLSEKSQRRYLESAGLQLTTQQHSKHNELLVELFPRQVKELGLRLRIRHLLTLHDEKPINTVLFHGPPGLGKTEAAAYVARQGNFRFVEQPSTGLVDKYQNSGAEKFQAVIDEAIKHYERTKEESFIFMDEFDAIGKDLKDTDATMVTNRQTEQAALMHIWQAVLKYKDDTRFVFCFGTNKMKSLHKTFISRFREEHIIEFKLPDATHREIALKQYLKAYDFSLTKELTISEQEAQKTLAMLVKHSDGMNLRALCDAVRSFKGQKSLSALNDDDIVRVTHHLKEISPQDLLVLKTKLGVRQENKIDAMIVAIHEQLTGKEIGTKASTNKELYDILMRTKAKDGYDWAEQMRRYNETLSKDIDPWMQRFNLYYYVVAGGLGYALWQFVLKPYLNPQSDPNIDRLVQQQVQARLVQLGLAGAGLASGAAAALGQNNNDGKHD